MRLGEVAVPLFGLDLRRRAARRIRAIGSHTGEIDEVTLDHEQVDGRADAVITVTCTTQLSPPLADLVLKPMAEDWVTGEWNAVAWPLNATARSMPITQQRGTARAAAIPHWVPARVSVDGHGIAAERCQVGDRSATIVVVDDVVLTVCAANVSMDDVELRRMDVATVQSNYLA